MSSELDPLNAVKNFTDVEEIAFIRVFTPINPFAITSMFAILPATDTPIAVDASTIPDISSSDNSNVVFMTVAASANLLISPLPCIRESENVILSAFDIDCSDSITCLVPTAVASRALVIRCAAIAVLSASSRAIDIFLVIFAVI